MLHFRLLPPLRVTTSTNVTYYNEKKNVTPEGLEPPTLRFGILRAANCATKSIVQRLRFWQTTKSTLATSKYRQLRVYCCVAVVLETRRISSHAWWYRKNICPFQLLWPQLSMKFRQIALPQSHSYVNVHYSLVPSKNPFVMLAGRSYVWVKMTISRE